MHGAPESFRRAVEEVAGAVAAHLASAVDDASAVRQKRAVLPPIDVAGAHERFAALIAQGGARLEDVVAPFLDGANAVQSPRFVGHQVAPPEAETVAVLLATAAVANSTAIFEMGPTGIAVERALVDWMCARIGYGEAGGGTLVNGGSLGNLTALLAARQARAGFDVWQEGLAGAEPLSVLASDQAHYCVGRAVQMLGLGAGGAVPVATDGSFRMTRAALDDGLARSRAAGRRAFAVVASACSTSTGSYDDLEMAADFCEEHGLWLHADGAHGASALLSPRLAGRLAGIERADSVVWDAHKMLLCPSLCTGVLFRDATTLDRAFLQDAPYLFGAGEPDPARRTIECTRQTLGLPLLALLATRGEDYVRSYLESRHELAERFFEMLGAAPDFEPALAPESNIVCFRHVPPGLSDERVEALQGPLRARIVESGRFYLVTTRLGGRTYLRTTLVNADTTEAHLAELLEALRVAASGLV